MKVWESTMSFIFNIINKVKGERGRISGKEWINLKMFFVFSSFDFEFLCWLFIFHFLLIQFLLKKDLIFIKKGYLVIFFLYSIFRAILGMNLYSIFMYSMQTNTSYISEIFSKKSTWKVEKSQLFSSKTFYPRSFSLLPYK